MTLVLLVLKRLDYHIRYSRATHNTMQRLCVAANALATNKCLFILPFISTAILYSFGRLSLRIHKLRRDETEP